uniref:Ig-like domain-containing protein n=1 Tax=Cyclopterus lumpus TaxID=8103 RepID=A0A8C3AZ30_CYCLU
YMVLILNILTCDSSALPIAFKQKLRNVLIEEGNTAVLRCELSKSGHTVEWMKSGTELIKSGDKYHMRQREVLIELRIFDVMPEDSDIYTCICGSIETTATLTVNELRNVQVQEGNGVTLCCELSKPGTPVQWKKEDNALTNGEKYQMKQSGSTLEFLIRKSQPEDSGTYSCVCDDITTTATIIITGETVEEGSVTLRCELSKPGVPVEWRKDAQLLTEGDKYQMKQEGRMAELLIRNLTLTDLGEYSCFVGTTADFTAVSTGTSRPQPTSPLHVSEDCNYMRVLRVLEFNKKRHF